MQAKYCAIGLEYHLLPYSHQTEFSKILNMSSSRNPYIKKVWFRCNLIERNHIQSCNKIVFTLNYQNRGPNTIKLIHTAHVVVVLLRGQMLTVYFEGKMLIELKSIPAIFKFLPINGYSGFFNSINIEYSFTVEPFCQKSTVN